MKPEYVAQATYFLRGDLERSPDQGKARRGEMLIYPQRKRCMRCRRFFGFLILAGLWCSYECAGHPAPSLDPADWPRGHFVPFGWGRRRVKKVFDDEAEALAYPSRQGKSVYLCDYCLTWHIGTTRTKEQACTSR